MAEIPELRSEIEHAREKLTEYEAAEPSRTPDVDSDNVWRRYGYLLGLVQSLIRAYDAEHGHPGVGGRHEGRAGDCEAVR